MRGGCSRSGGWLLVGLITLLSGVLVVLAGIALALGEGRAVVSLSSNQTEAFYLAQAGVMRAIYDFRRNAGVRLGGQPDYVVDAGPAAGNSDDDLFILSGPLRDFLLLNMKSGSFASSGGPSVCGSRNRLQGWTVRNVLAAGGGNLTVDRVQVNWLPDAGERVMRIALSGGSVWTAPGCVGRPANQEIDVANQTIGPGQRWATNRVYFNATMAGKLWIDVMLIMSDGSVRAGHYEQASMANRSADVTIRSIGEVRRGAFPFVTWRRLEAEYRLCGGVSAASQCDSSGEERTNAGRVLWYRELAQRTP